jgi:hypothetical protein
MPERLMIVGASKCIEERHASRLPGIHIAPIRGHFRTPARGDFRIRPAKRTGLARKDELNYLSATGLHLSWEPTMNIPMYAHSVPVFKQLLTALKTMLLQAEAHATAKSIEPQALLQARLYPDMFPLLKQVQVAAEFARGITARLAGVEVPAVEGKEQTFADLDQLLAQTLAFLDSVNATQFADREAVEIVLRPGSPKEKKLTGQTYLANYGLPQLLFHLTTAYAILRHNGIAIGKRDFMGSY